MKLDAIKIVLEERLQELLEEAHEIDHELREPLDPDSEERAVELEDDEVLEALGNTALVEITQIRSALHRIESGTYGICTRCGENVVEPRLVAVPHTPLCIKCAGKSSS